MSLLLRLIPGSPAVSPIRGIQSYTNPPLANRSRLVNKPLTTAAGPQTIAVGQAFEQDSAQTVTPFQPAAAKVVRGSIKTYQTPALPNRTRLYHKPGQTIAVGQAFENDLSQAVTVVTTQHPAVQAISVKPFTAAPLPNKSRLYARYGKTIAVGQAFENDLSQSVTVVTTDHPTIEPTYQIKAYSTPPLPNKSRVLFREGKTVVVGQAFENDLAQSVAVVTTEHPSVEATVARGYQTPPLPNQSRLHYEAVPAAPNTVTVGQAFEQDLSQAIAVVLTEYPSVEPFYAQGYQTPPLPNVSRLHFETAAAAQIISVGQAFENDLAQNITVILTQHPATTATVARGFTAAPLPNKSRLYAKPGQTRTVGQALEADLAQPISIVITEHPGAMAIHPIPAYQTPGLPNKSRLYSRIGYTISVAQAFENDLAQPIQVVLTDHPPIKTQYKAHSPVQVPNRSRFYINPAATTIAVGQAFEQDTALTISPLQGTILPVQFNKATGFTAPPLPNRSRICFRAGITIAVGQAFENDLSQPITIVTTEHPSVRTVRQIQAYQTPPLKNQSRLYSKPGQTITVGQAFENDLAQAIAVVTTDHSPVRVTRAISAFSTTPLPNKSRLYSRQGKTVSVGQAFENDSAQNIVAVLTDKPVKVYRGIAAFSTTPLPNKSRLVVVKAQPQTVLVGQAFESDLAQAIKCNQAVHVGIAFEQDSAGAITVSIATGFPTVNRGRKPHNSLQVPNLSRFFEIIRPDITPIGPTFTSGGVRPNRIITDATDGAIATDVKNTRTSSKQGDVTIDARLRKNRIIGDG